MVNGSPSPSQGGDSNTNSSDKKQDDAVSRLEKEIDSLTILLRSKEKEWNAILKLKKLKEISLEHLRRQSEIVNILESHPTKDVEDNDEAMEEAVSEERSNIGPDESQVQINCIKTEKQISELEVRLKSNSFKTACTKNSSPAEIKLENFEATIALQQLCEKNRTSCSQTNSISTNNANATTNKIIGEGRQGPIVEVRSIIADYRSKNPDEALASSSSRRPGKNVALLKPLLKTRSDISYKDVLVTLAKMSQQENMKEIPVGTTSASSSTNSIATVAKTDNRVRSANSSTGVMPAVNPTRGPLATTLAKLLSSNSTVTAGSNRSEETNAHNNSIHFSSSSLVPAENTLSLANLLASSKCLDEEVKPDEEEIPLCQGCSTQRAQFVCAGCGNQWYCSRECQVAAWDDHSELCSS